jgi:hypothetical protein
LPFCNLLFDFVCFLLFDVFFALMHASFVNCFLVSLFFLWIFHFDACFFVCIFEFVHFPRFRRVFRFDACLFYQHLFAFFDLLFFDVFIHFHACSFNQPFWLLPFSMDFRFDICFFWHVF